MRKIEEDTYEWAYSNNSCYSVRSGYWVATHVDVQENNGIRPPLGSIALKRDVWKLHVAPKIHHFLWRCLSGALATTTQLRTRSIPADPICQRCCQEEETVNHILFTCPFAQMVWRCTTSQGHHRFSAELEDNINKLLQYYKDQTIPLVQRISPFWIMWRLWKSRNEFLFQKISRSPDKEGAKGHYEAQEWAEVNKEKEASESFDPSNPNQPRYLLTTRQWCSPPRGWLKCNFDSGFINGRSYTNTGWVIRDSEGHVVLAGCAKLQQAWSSLQAEALGFLHVLQVMWAHGMRNIWFEGDNLELTNLINTCSDHILLGPLLFDIRHWMTKLPDASLDHVNREKNSAADKLAQYASSMTCLYHVFHSPPSWLIDFLYQPYTI